MSKGKTKQELQDMLQTYYRTTMELNAKVRELEQRISDLIKLDEINKGFWDLQCNEIHALQQEVEAWKGVAEVETRNNQRLQIEVDQLKYVVQRQAVKLVHQEDATHMFFEASQLKDDDSVGFSIEDVAEFAEEFFKKHGL